MRVITLAGCLKRCRKNSKSYFPSCRLAQTLNILLPSIAWLISLRHSWKSSIRTPILACKSVLVGYAIKIRYFGGFFAFMISRAQRASAGYHLNLKKTLHNLTTSRHALDNVKFVLYSTIRHFELFAQPGDGRVCHHRQANASQLDTVEHFVCIRGVPPRLIPFRKLRDRAGEVHDYAILASQDCLQAAL